MNNDNDLNLHSMICLLLYYFLMMTTITLEELIQILDSKLQEKFELKGGNR